jgi:hypothetical protein
VYLQISKRLNEQQIQTILKRFEQNISAIPEENLNGIVAGLLPKVSNGITSVSDEVSSEKGESYTSQIRKSLFDAMGQIKPQATVSCQEGNFDSVKSLIEGAISQAVSDLQSKGYQ